MIRFSDKVKSISIWYANLNGYALPLSPEQLLNAVVAWVDEYGGDHIYFDNPPEGTEVNVGDIKISSTTWEVQQWNGREWESYGSIAGVAATVEIGEVETLPAGSDAYVENEGTEFAARLKIGIPQGAQGPQGEQGERGAQGEPGRDGTNGADGAAATIEIAETTTLPAGSSATVENIGTSSAARLKFGIPQGQSGETGQVVFRAVNVQASGTIGAEDLAAIASSPEGVVLIDEQNRRYECSCTPSGSYIYITSTSDDGLTLYIYTIASGTGAYSRTSSTIEVPPPTVIPTPSFSDNENASVSQSSNGYSYEAANMSFNGGSYPVPVNLPIKAGSGIAMDIGSDGKSVEISVDENDKQTEIELTGESGTVDGIVIALVQKAVPSVYVVCDGEYYYYADNMSGSGYAVYSHVGMNSSNQYFIKTITFVLNTGAWTKNVFTLSSAKKVYRHKLTIGIVAQVAGQTGHEYNFYTTIYTSRATAYSYGDKDALNADIGENAFLVGCFYVNPSNPHPEFPDQDGYFVACYPNPSGRVADMEMVIPELDLSRAVWQGYDRIDDEVTEV